MLTNQMSLSLCVINLFIVKQGGRQVYYHNYFFCLFATSHVLLKC